jgi:inner membrane protein
VFIAHLPSGWLATRALLRAPAEPHRRRLLALGMFASILPDLDLLWFFFVDHRRTVHHAYLTHKPGAWLIALAAAALGMWMLRARRTAWLALAVLGANVMLHLVLDSTAGGIRWLWPASEAELALSHPPALHDPWWLNFVLHWTFALELAIVAAALAALIVRKRTTGRNRPEPRSLRIP